MYAYKVNSKFKIYRPLNSKYTKWRTNLEITDIQGYAQLPDTNDLLIITKSLKDIAEQSLKLDILFFHVLYFFCHC